MRTTWCLALLRALEQPPLAVRLAVDPVDSGSVPELRQYHHQAPVGLLVLVLVPGPPAAGCRPGLGWPVLRAAGGRAGQGERLASAVEAGCLGSVAPGPHHPYILATFRAAFLVGIPP
ncbi:hypothetical protein D3C86_1695600 [compost metagenome]